MPTTSPRQDGGHLGPVPQLARAAVPTEHLGIDVELVGERRVILVGEVGLSAERPVEPHRVVIRHGVILRALDAPGQGCGQFPHCLWKTMSPDAVREPMLMLVEMTCSSDPCTQ